MIDQSPSVAIDYITITSVHPLIASQTCGGLVMMAGDSDHRGCRICPYEVKI